MRTWLKVGLVGGVLFTLPLISIPLVSYAEKSDTYELLNLFGDVFERIRTDYVEEVKDQDLIEAALNGMLTSLDPHSNYMSEKNYKEMQVQTRGEFGGLGIEVTMDNGLVKVVSPIDDTPAFKAGIEAGDYITQIDNEQVMGLTLSEAVEKMRGPAGSKIKITVVREGVKDPIDYNIIRAVIKIQTVKSRAEGNIGYVRVTSFSEPTYDAMKSAIDKLRKEVPDMRGLVLDLRNNPGGLLDQAVSVADAFLDKGEIVSTRERDPMNTKRFSATPGDMTEGLPIVVLINNGSASASEIVSGALQDHKRAVIMGTPSFGKGSVQTVIPLPGHGAMRLTTSRYYTPSGHSIQAKGITPDIIVEQAKIEPIKNDRERFEADLRGRLANPEDADKDKKVEEETLPEDEELDNEEKPENAPDKEEPKTGKKSDKDKEAEKDFQLARALDLLRALSVYKQQSSGN